MQRRLLLAAGAIGLVGLAHLLLDCLGGYGSIADAWRGMHLACALGTSQRLRCLYEHYDEAPLFDHWMEYAEHYEAHFPQPCASSWARCEPVKLLEIGVQSGGSTRLWRQYYGPSLTYVGVDINPACKRSEVPEERTFVEIGSQLDAAFLLRVCDKHGPFDAVIDDGGHTSAMIDASLRAIWPEDRCMKNTSVYAVEDLHAMRFGPSPQPFLDLFGELEHAMHWYHAKEPAAPQTPHPIWGNRILGLHFYDSLLFLQRGVAPRLTRFMRGDDKIPYAR